MNGRSYHVAGLFAGIGGFERGLALAGHETSFLCELDPAAAAVLSRRFPECRITSDIRKVGSLPPETQVVTAGFPCQNLSSSGRKDGISGDQSTLVDEVFRLLKRRPCEWVVLENVRFMLHLEKGAAMERIVSGFEALGYRWAYRVVDSSAFGVPQRRHRVFFVASPEHDPRSILFADETRRADEETQPSSYGFYWTEGTYATGLAADGVPPLKGGSTIGIPSPPAVLFPDGRVGTPDIRDAERLQGFPVNWTSPAAKATRQSFRWKLLGNAVTVPVAKWIGQRLAAPGTPPDDSGAPLLGKWPYAAWGDGEHRYVHDCSDRPLGKACRPIASFLKYPVKPLSHKAVSGFLRRAHAGNLRYPEGFLSALEAYRDACDAVGVA